MKLIKRRIKESKSNIEFMVVYVNSIDSATVKLNDRNYNDVESLMEEAYKSLVASDPNASDDFWIDDIDVLKGDLDPKIDWKMILTSGGSHLDQDMVDLIFEDPDVAIKIEFLVKNRGEKVKDIDESMLEDVLVYDASRDSIAEGNYSTKYPESWVYDQAENIYYDIYKILEKYNAIDYFDFARLISDDEINGGFDSGWVGNDYFVTYNR